MSSFYEWQMRFIYFLQSFSNPFLDGFFNFLNYFDTLVFYFLMLPIVWVGYKRKWGIRLYFLIIISTLVGQYLKNIFSQPRPFFLDPNVCKIIVKGYGFPSGAAIASVMLGTILIYTWRNRLSWIIGLNYIFWVSLARIYLGVHFLTDVLGGWVIGLAWAYIFFKSYPPIERFIKSLPLNAAYLLSQLLGVILFFVSGDRYDIYLSSTTMGIGAGLYLQARYNNFLEDGKKFFEIALRSSLAVLGAIGLYFLINYIFSLFTFSYHIPIKLFVQFYVIGFWISFLVNYICKPFLKNEPISK